MEEKGEIKVGIDLNSHVTIWNEAAVAMSGFSSADTIGRDFADYFLTEEAKHVFEAMRKQSLHGKEMDGSNMTFFRKDGIPVELLVCARPCTEADGSVVGWVLMGSTVPKHSELTAEDSAENGPGQKNKEAMSEALYASQSTTMDSMDSFCESSDATSDE